MSSISVLECHTEGLAKPLERTELTLTTLHCSILNLYPFQAAQQKAALEQQAMQLSMEFQQKKAEEEMQKQQFEMEKKQQEMQMKMQEGKKQVRLC